MGGSEGTVVRGLVLHCHILTTKSLHQCSVRFQPTLPTAADEPLQSSSSFLAPPSTTANGAEEVTVYSEDLLDVTLSSTKGELASTSHVVERCRRQMCSIVSSTVFSAGKFYLSLYIPH